MKTKEKRRANEKKNLWEFLKNICKSSRLIWLAIKLAEEWLLN